MAFTNLPTDLQNIYLVNLEFILKVCFIIFLVFICIKQIKKLKESEKTPYLLVAQSRALLGFISYLILFIIPFISLFIFYPTFGFDTIQIYVMRFYIIFGIIFSFMFMLNVFFFTSTFLVKFAGFDINAEKNNKVMNHLSKLAGGIKFKKNELIYKLKNKWGG